ncbi:VIT and VWA domain-containing protein [Paeniroseomonas aquatica]|uniref:VIT and VWA domain-containing protein n=1 Tax=Paeniroseomonas aquatica TaxID=373043 RepID=A0ABT8A521_9PROT|nr:VIT and VWA domain-containing protein [Paeniroseomonas aquatica]MDN3564892.1 VIT and VWA domain-containing protein [Paeniroseomonas aquatica]
MPASATPIQDPLGRFRHLAVLAGTQRPIPLAATRFAVRFLGNLALVTAERCFRNDEDHSIEATMTFPVPVQAALVGMSARIGERRVVAATQRRSAARATYEAAIDDGRTAVLHEEVLRGVHMISVGHVPPGQEVAVLGTWAIPLAAAGGGARLVIPTTVGDVYGRSPLPDSDDLMHAPILLEADLEVRCDSGLASLEGGRLVEGRARVTLNAPIAIRVTGAAPRLLHGLAADGRAVTLAIEPAPAGEAVLDALLLLDNSGSMDEAAAGGHGSRARMPSKHAVALHGLADIAAGLRPADRLDVWEFNSRPRHLGLGVGAAAVGALVARLRPPTGGTETGEAIEAALAGQGAADVLLVTDGQSHALDVHGLARRGARFTVVLVGEDSLEANVGHLAALTGGEIFVSSGLDLAEVLQRAIASLRGARLHQPGIAAGQAPESAAALTGGMRATARWEPAATPAAPAETGAEAGEGRAIAAYAAWLALPRLGAAEAVALAEAEGVVCHLTSMVLVDAAGEAQQGIPAQRKVPLMSLGPLAGPDPLMPMDAACYAGPVVAAMPASARAAAGMALPPDATASPAPRSGRPPRMVQSGSAEAGRRDPGFPPPPRGAGAFGRLSSRARSGASRGVPITATAAAPGNLRGSLDQVDWTGNMEALRQGRLQGNVPPEVLVQLEAAAGLAEVKALAALLGVTAEAVAVSLLARAEGMSSRGAARFARTVFGAADKDLVEAAARAVGL